MNQVKQKLYHFLKIVLVAVLYYVLGLFSFEFSVSNSIVTNVIFLPEGVGLAFVILFGPLMAIGVFIGQFFLALSTDIEAPIALIISLSNSSILVLGAFIYKKYSKNRNSFEYKDYLLLSLLIFFVLQPLSSFIGNITLLQFQKIGFIIFFDNVLNWFLGNVIGQLTFTPTILIVYYSVKNKISIKKSEISYIGITIIGTILIYVISDMLASSYKIILYLILFPYYIVLLQRTTIRTISVSLLISTLLATILFANYFNDTANINFITLDLILILLHISIMLLTLFFDEKKKIEKNIRQSEQKYRKLFEKSKDPVLLLDGVYFIDYNQATLDILKVKTKDELKKYTPAELSPEFQPDGRSSIKKAHEYIKIAYKKGYHRFEWVHLTTKGDEFIVEVSLTAMPVDGKIMLYTIWRDITKRKENEKKLSDYRKKLENTNRTKDKMLSIIGHDLRNPILGLKSLIQMIIEDLNTMNKDKIKETLEILLSTTGSTYDLLENLLTWANSQQNKIPFEPEEFVINHIINDNIAVVKNAAENKNIQLINNIDIDIYVYADKNMISFIIRNLISNAVKFTEFGGQIIISHKKIGNYQEISIIDNGVGIEEKKQKEIFDEEFYISTLGTNNEKGSGLGLMLCNDFIHRNNGEIGVISKIGIGSTFFVKLPISSPQNDAL